MGTFSSSRTFPIAVDDLAPVARDVMGHFEEQDYEVTGESTVSGGWYVSIRKGDAFKAVLGMKTALNIEIESTIMGTMARASIGIFGQQFIPTVISMLIFWPVIITQIWGMAQSAKLDEEALATVERSLMAHSTAKVDASGGGSPVPATEKVVHCTNCGAQVQPSAKFCSECGSKIAA
jgi:hypothetical protein